MGPWCWVQGLSESTPTLYCWNSKNTLLLVNGLPISIQLSRTPEVFGILIDGILRERGARPLLALRRRTVLTLARNQSRERRIPRRNAEDLDLDKMEKISSS